MQALKVGALVGTAVVLAACGGAKEAPVVREAEAAQPRGTATVVRDSMVTATMEATAVAEPFAQATVSTKLMGTVTAVLVKEGDRVSAGQPMVRIDARDLDAKRQQVEAGIASAEAMYQEALLMTNRMRALHADSAAPRAQLDAAEAGLARAQAGVNAAKAGAGELDAIAGYAVVRAPFAGTVTQRFVDPGAFAAPGAPLVTVQDNATLRIAATVSPTVARGVSRGSTVTISVEGVASTAKVEGVVPSAGGSLYTINAIADNRRGELSAGGAARLVVGQGTRQALLIPALAVRREGDMTGVQATSGGVTTTRWIRLGATIGNSVEVLAGLAAGDTVWVPSGAAQE
jgi:RND family efflux transporter MFP subunit